MRMVGVGHLLFALGFLVLGAMCLAAHDFILWQEPVPKEFPWREPLALVNGALLLVTGAGLLFARSAKVAALTLTGLLFIVWVLATQLTRALAHPAVELYWLGVGEDTTLATGGWVIYCALAGRDDASLRLARRVFGIALVPIGLSHFFYTQNAIQLMPSWFPLHVPFTLFTGCAHIAAGLALAFGIVPRLAATLEASMESIITLVCWGSAVVAATFRDHWVNLFISTTLSAAAWAVAASYRNSSWGWAPRWNRRDSVATASHAHGQSGICDLRTDLSGSPCGHARPTGEFRCSSVSGRWKAGKSVRASGFMNIAAIGASRADRTCREWAFQPPPDSNASGERMPAGNWRRPVLSEGRCTPSRHCRRRRGSHHAPLTADATAASSSALGEAPHGIS